MPPSTSSGWRRDECPLPTGAEDDWLRRRQKELLEDPLRAEMSDLLRAGDLGRGAL
ncbi:MAG: hypothetical protein JSS68_14180 [Actinobacteria bacterium]|nr:hypothetical protein [Actinomycetota bacterium]